MGKHTRPGTPAPVCAYGVHYGASMKSTLGTSTYWTCLACGGCTGVSSMSTTTEAVVSKTLFIPPFARKAV